MENEKSLQMSPEQIKFRSQRIRLNASDLARRSNRGVTTAYIFLAGDAVHPHTRAAIIAALEAEEAALLEHLLALKMAKETAE